MQRLLVIIKSVRNDDDLHAAFNQLQLVFQAPEGTPQADEREVLVTLIEAYQQRHYPVDSAEPTEAIKFRMEPQNLTPKDLERPRTLHWLQRTCVRGAQPQTAPELANGQEIARRFAHPQRELAGSGLALRHHRRLDSTNLDVQLGTTPTQSLAN